MTGTGYSCAGVTCTSTTTLPAGTDGAPITVTATVAASTTTSQHNVAYITPAPGETTETNPLGVPATGTDTTSSPTDNDAHADVAIEAPVVAPPTPSTPSTPTLSPATKIPVTGSDTRQQLTNSLAFLALGFTLLVFARRRNQHSPN